MMAYAAFSQKLTMAEKARFCAALLTAVNAAANAAHATPASASDRRLRSRAFESIHVLSAGPAVPATEETVQSRYVA